MQNRQKLLWGRREGYLFGLCRESSPDDTAPRIGTHCCRGASGGGGQRTSCGGGMGSVCEGLISGDSRVLLTQLAQWTTLGHCMVRLDSTGHIIQKVEFE